MGRKTRRCPICRKKVPRKELGEHIREWHEKKIVPRYEFMGFPIDDFIVFCILPTFFIVVALIMWGFFEIRKYLHF